MSVAKELAAGVSQVASRLRRAPDKAVAPAPVEAQPDPLAQVVSHLEYFGYAVGAPDPDGWRFVTHPSRYNFHILSSPFGLRLHCAVAITIEAGARRQEWLDYLNTATEQARVAQFSLFQDKFGQHWVRMRAVISGAYSQPVFALMMDMWHDDLDLVRRKPAFPSSEGEADVRAASGTVH